MDAVLSCFLSRKVGAHWTSHPDPTQCPGSQLIQLWVHRPSDLAKGTLVEHFEADPVWKGWPLKPQQPHKFRGRFGAKSLQESPVGLQKLGPGREGWTTPTTLH